ncbi:hypothetical protein [Kitasatospora cheerisanensis]|uniref:Uncharacterized protein n=1 Tax=Kitasatospora cheerisanensis KCTC 2395 TaxID=1348663 RepID=A0A066YHW9_9ACTN|nr:hypothetical protein [Kitasatospora cheerisanensis]KDN80712.1 hypothetical protein KCH_74920 [Kitasatospora cheerisanensis KCTC 2395]
MTDLQPHRPVVTRAVDGAICAYRPSGRTPGELAPVAVFRPADGDAVVSRAVPADLARAYYATPDAVVCVAADGEQLWRAPFRPEKTEEWGHTANCALSADDRQLWVYRPDAMAGRGDTDRWEVLDPATGALLGRADLETVGHGGEHWADPTSGTVLLDIGEGQDGTTVYRGRLTAAGLDVERLPWDDRCPIGLSPDGRRLLTVDHTQEDATVLDLPGGELRLTVALGDFGAAPEEHEAMVEWSGGYLDPDTLLLVLTGETEDEQEWFQAYRVDAHDGRILGEFSTHAANPYDLQPLGDGSWLTTGASGHPVRWFAG